MTRRDGPKSHQRISHDITDDCPIRVRFDRWDLVGPGMRDMHFEVELGMVLRGRLSREYAGVRKDFGPGEFWVHGIWEPHAAYVEEAPLEHVVVHVHPVLLSTLSFREAAQLNWLSPFIAPVGERPGGTILGREEVFSYCRQFRETLNKANPWQKIHQRLLFFSLLSRVLEAWASPLCVCKADSVAATRLERVFGLIFGESRWVGAEEAAKICRMSRNGFNRFFENHMGMSFSHFALHHRLSCSAAELLESDHAIKGIAAKWGFTDVSHFYRRFLAVYGCTPAQYQRNKGIPAE